MQPCHDVIALKRIEKTEGFITREENVGEVVAVGPNKQERDGMLFFFCASVGDKILYEGEPVAEHDGLLFIHDEQVLAII